MAAAMIVPALSPTWPGMLIFAALGGLAMGVYSTIDLDLMSRVLPDTSRFDAIEDIEQGISISLDTLLGAASVLAGFGISAIVLAYVILLGKEVAP